MISTLSAFPGLSFSISFLFRVAGIVALILLNWPLQEAHAETENSAPATQLADLPLEDLMKVQVYSVSKRPESLFTSAAAIYVITGEDIRSSGVTSLPEALRMVPGVQVSRIDGNKWAISIRGFAGRFSNKLLVLQDGRTLYNPMFSGVYWNVQEIFLEDIEKIEVIRGAGATLWGANAVNGVINITTKHAGSTPGGLITVSGGSSERAATAFRYGSHSGENGFVRAYGKFFYRDGQPPVATPDLEGYWSDWRSGFRGDWDLTSKDAVNLQGDLFESRAGAGEYKGGNLIGHWNRILSETAVFSLQLYYDHSSAQSRLNPEKNHREMRDTADLQLQHSFAVGDRQKIVWGSGFQITSDRLNSDNSANPQFIPSAKSDFLYSAFLQDNVSLIPETMNLILGSRLEHNDVTGWELQPTARVLWTPHLKHTFWSAVSRAVRTPSRAETSISALVDFIPPATEVKLLGNPRVPSEVMIAYEAGYRYKPFSFLSFDLALFYNDYRRLIGVVQGAPEGGPPPTLVPVNVTGSASAIGTGGELSINYRPVSWIDLALSYSYLDLTVKSSSASPESNIIMNADTYPRHQISLSSILSLPNNVSSTLRLRYVGSLPGPGVSDYVTADARIAWRPLPNLELSLVGQNLLEPKHLEFGPDFFGNPAAQTVRSFYGKVAWTF